MRTKILRLLMVAVVLISVIAVSPLVRQADRMDRSNSPLVFGLARPAFAQSAGSPFPENEAGISAYANAGEAIDMGEARTLLTVIEETTEDYVIGTVALAGHKEDMWPHVYVGKDGWLLAYYPKSEPSSKLVQWYGYQRDVVTTTTLRDTLVSLGRDLSLDLAKISETMKYYHFQHPDATKLLIVVDTEEGSDSFRYTIPSGIALYDAAWSHHGADIKGGGWDPSSESRIDGFTLHQGGGGTYVACGDVEGQHLTPDTPHEVLIQRSRSGWVGLALIFLYR